MLWRPKDSTPGDPARAPLHLFFVGPDLSSRHALQAVPSWHVLLRRLPWLIVAGLLLVAAETALVALFGPPPYRPQPGEYLTQLGAENAFIEPSDRLILGLWWMTALVLMGIGGFWRARGGAGRLGTVSVVMASVALVVLVWSTMWAGHLWIGIPGSGLVLGAVVVLAVVGIWFLPAAASSALSLVVGSSALAFTLPALFQLPGSLRDSGHFAFASDELAAVGAGHMPLADYVPMYTVLLGWPIAPLLKTGVGVFLVIVGYLLLLQVVSLAVSVALPVLVGGRRLLVPSLLLAVGPVIARVAEEVSASTYFPVTPLRTVLPALTILAAYLALGHARDSGSVRAWRFVGLGVLAGATALNNIDYGGAVAAAVALVILLAQASWRQGMLRLAWLVVGALGVFVAYTVVGFALGQPVSWGNWLLFARVGGVSGFWNEPMRPFGLHIAAVSLFVSAAVAGVVLLRVSRFGGSQLWRRQGVLLALVGGWSLLSLPYFAGRSYGQNLVAGYAFMIGMTAAAFLPLIRWNFWLVLRRPSLAGRSAVVGAALGAMLLVGVSAFWSLVKTPPEYMGMTWRDGQFTLTPEHSLVHSFVADDGVALVRSVLDSSDPQIRRIVDSGAVGQMLDDTSIVTLLTSMPSTGVLRKPGFDMPFSPQYADLQCAQPVGFEYVLMTRAVADLMRERPACLERFAFDSAIPVGSDGVLVPRRAVP